MECMVSGIQNLRVGDLLDGLGVSDSLSLNDNILNNTSNTSRAAFLKASLSTKLSSFSTQFLIPL